ncbi:leucine-rich repeat-containing protein 43-like [Melanotaenia boesemani]|uniref:leucine-rich repeat-containing protein 43-like n=1 Tax=Melanotaenia boesemani TaxID=1250792 RepID=UPI001C04907F|nr:leucine-rich repeat-containing protein 43-like [Melanotaenia boesemani]
MSSKTLSAVLEKLIHSLGLNNFPCGNGSWRETKDRPEGSVTFSTAELLDLLNCPRSPWWQNNEWSPQASPLRQLAVLTPEHLNPNFIYNYFTTLRILDKGVSVIDEGLLKFSKLEELVLSANLISEINGENLPSTIKTLELRANRLSSLKGLISCPPPQLQYLTLASNSLGSHQDVFHLTGNYWPQLVCLDLSDCDFQDQQALLNALSTLPCLKSLLLEGNPLTLAPGYPGFTVDSLPQLVCLDTSWISPEERDNFKGLAKMSDVIIDVASATVTVGRMRGIPDPLMSKDDKASDFPFVTYRYFITYKFFGHHSANDMKLDSESKFDTESTAHVTEDGSIDSDLQSDKNGERETSTPDTGVFNADKICFDTVGLSQHSTSKLPWSECMDFSDTQTYVVSSLGDFRKFLHQGLYLRLEEEKVLSWPAVPKDAPVAKPSQAVKEKKSGKGKEPQVKSASTKDKSKDKKRKSVPELIQDAPIRRVIGSAYVPLQSLVKGGQKVNVLCDFVFLHTDSEIEASQTIEKDLEKKIKEDKKKDGKEPKQRGRSSPAQKDPATLKGKEKESKQMEDNSVPFQVEPVTVELSVALEKWQSASAAHLFVLPQQNS